MQYLVWSLLEQRHGDLHPPTGFVAGHRFKPADLGSADEYDGLTDESAYGDYAWAFLRRNHFFQMHQEMPLGTPSDLDWGFATSDDGLGTCGYGGDKPYQENACSGIPVEWSILEQVAVFGLKNPEKDKYVVPKRKELRANRVAMVFQFDNFLGEEVDVIEIQLAVAREVLRRRRLAADLADPKSRPKAGPDRLHLRKLLRLADILTPQESEEPFELSKEEIRLRLENHGYGGENVKTMHTRIGEGIREASRWIYDFDYLSLLQWENPAKIVDGYVSRSELDLCAPDSDEAESE